MIHPGIIPWLCLIRLSPIVDGPDEDREPIIHDPADHAATDPFDEQLPCLGEVDWTEQVTQGLVLTRGTGLVKGIFIGIALVEPTAWVGLGVVGSVEFVYSFFLSDSPEPTPTWLSRFRGAKMLV